MWQRRRQPTSPESLTFHDDSGERAEFIQKRYLQEEYVVPEFIKETLAQASDALTASIPGFVGIVNVGGTANGSYELRRKLSPKAATDLDFYFVGHDEALPYLEPASDYVADAMRQHKIHPDGVLNGKRPSNFLNLDRVDEIIEQGDVNLLALPFQSMFGNTDEAKRIVVMKLLAMSDGQTIWDEVASYHIQSLSLHHGSFSEAFSSEIMDQHYPVKVQKFELPVTLEDALNSMDAPA